MSATATGGLRERIEDAMVSEVPYPNSGDGLDDAVTAGMAPWYVDEAWEVADNPLDNLRNRAFVRATPTLIQVIAEAIIAEARQLPREILNDPRSKVLRADLEVA